MRKLIATALFNIALLTMAGQAAAAAKPGEIETALAAARLDLRLTAEGRYSGAGWDRIVADGATAQFVMVGEQHGSGSIARFETALHAAMADRGFTHSVLEIGPWSTRFAESQIRSGPGRLAQFISTKGNGFSLPFLFFAEEVEMAEQMVRRSPDRIAALWGVDQEFIGAAPIHLAFLSRHARTPAQKRAIALYSAKAAASPFALGDLSDSELETLVTAFRGNKQALALAEGLRRSAHIYAPFVKHTGSGYVANLDRETLMKQSFLREFAAAERRNGKAPKVFFKFGGNHAMRGFSATNVSGFANFLAEWGLSRNSRLVNMIVDCDGGEAMSPQSVNPIACEPYLGSNSALAKVVTAGGPFQVFDLVPLRRNLARWDNIDPVTRQTILAFDYYVSIRGGRAATLIGKMPETAK